jgi:AcrR family transcriptional regulator
MAVNTPAPAPDATAVASTEKPRRGRPRDPRVHGAILRAARELLRDGGPAAVTMEAVAERAGVGKPTVYRWWPNRHAVTMAALMDAAPTRQDPARRNLTRTTGGPRPLRELQQQLLAVADTLASRTGRHVGAMIASADPDTEVAKAFRHHFVLARRNEGRQLLERAVAMGELRQSLDLDVALDQIYGALFFRVLLGHAAVDAAFVRELLAQCLAGLAAPRPARATTKPKPKPQENAKERAKAG